MLHNNDGMVGAVAERSTAALRVAGSNPARNKYLYGLQVLFHAICVCDFFMFVNAPTIQDVFQRWGTTNIKVKGDPVVINRAQIQTP